MYPRSEGRIRRGHKEIREAMDMFVVLIVVMVSWVYTNVNTSNCTL